MDQAVTQALQVLHAHTSSIEDRETAQSFLLSALRSTQVGWPQISSWITSQDRGLQVYATQCLQVKIAQSSADSLLDWKQVLLSAFDALQTGQLVLCEAARLKLFQAMATLMFASLRVWPEPIMELIERAPRCPQPVLEVLTAVAEESERFAFGPDQRYKWLHELKGSFTSVSTLLQNIPPESPTGLYKAKLACQTAWIKAGMPVDPVEVQLAFAALKVPELSDASLDLLTEIVGLLSLPREASLALIPLLLEAQSEDEEAYRLIVSYAEAHCDDAFNALIENDPTYGQKAYQFFEALLRITGTPGTYLIDEHASASSLHSWCIIHDLAIDFGLPASPLVVSLFRALAEALLRKAELPGESQGTLREFKAEFDAYRRDLADAMLYCWRVIGDHLYSILAITDNLSWQKIEARLWAFLAISEEVSEQHQEISNLLHSLPTLGQHPRNRALAVRLLGAFAHLRQGPEGTIQLLLEEIKSGSAESALEAARALQNVQDETPDLIVPHLPQMIQLLGIEHLALTNAVARTLGAAIGEAPNQLALLGQAIDASSIRLPTLCALLRSISLAADSIYPGAEGFQSLQRVGQLLQADLLIPHETYRETCELGEAFFLCCGQGCFDHLLGPVVYSLIDALQRPDLLCPPLLELACTALCIHPRPDLIETVIGPIIRPELFQDEDLAEGVLNLLSKVAGKGLAGLSQLDLTVPLTWSIQRLAHGSLSTPLLRAILKLQISLLTSSDEAYAHWLESIYSQHGPPLLQAALHSACNLMPRSQIDSVGRLIFELFQRFSQPSRAWLHQILAPAEFPSPKQSEADKATFQKGIAASRSVGKAKQLLADFCKL